MTDKRVKHEQWSVKELISKINNREIIKPKYQRKRKWDILPKKKNNTPNEKSYIKFLYETQDSVHAITFGQESNSQYIFYSNIDGNNRINAIKHFIDKPFEIFSEYLDDLNKYIDKIDILQENKDLLKKIFIELSYCEILNFKYNKYFIKIGYKELYNNKLKIYRDDFEPYIESIQNKLIINSNEQFDTCVKINVNLFQGYDTHELCDKFHDMNKFINKLTETEILACRLHDIYNFSINNKLFKTELIECIKEYYKEKSNNEVLDCYIFDENAEINAHDFIIGFQNLCNKKYNFINKTNIDGLSLFFKLWKLLYENFDKTFTTNNINDFIEKINYSCEILKQTISYIFTDKINIKLFNKTCQDKLKTLKKNNLFILISSIIGFKRKNKNKDIVINNLSKCLVYHFFVSDIKEKTKRDFFQNNDSITFKAGGQFIENETKNLLKNPENISNKIDKDSFNNLLDHLFDESKLPHVRKLDNGKNKNDKRRKLRFFEKTLMFFYYKSKIPSDMLDNDFSIEHICPNSSEWEGELDKDRTGNLIPIISTINFSRGNKHIKYYYNTDEGKNFFKFIENIIPKNNVYNNIIEHDKRPKIKNNKEFNKMCKNNEKIYKENIINCLFK